MPNRQRELPPVMHSDTKEGDSRPCHMMTGIHVSTVQLPEGHFAAFTVTRPDLPAGAMLIMDRDEVDYLVETLAHAMEDAELLDRGLPPIHTIGVTAVKH